MKTYKQKLAQQFPPEVIEAMRLEALGQLEEAKEIIKTRGKKYVEPIKGEGD